MQYKPGLLLCPYTKLVVKFDDVKHKLRHYSRLPLEFKRKHLKNATLIDWPHGQQTEREMIAGLIKQDLGSFPFLYDDV